MTEKLTDARVFEAPWSDDLGDVVPTCYLLGDAPVDGAVFMFRRYLTGERTLFTDEPMTRPGVIVYDPVRIGSYTLEQRYVCHSPTGFEWGYGGSGPADLALNILGLFVPAPEAWSLHHAFKSAFIAKLPRDGGDLKAKAVREWIEQQWRDEAVEGSQA